MRVLFFSSWKSSLALDVEEEYKMNNKRRGLALIFSQERFFWHLRLNDRQGSEADRWNLEKRYLFQLSYWRRNTVFGFIVCSWTTSLCLASKSSLVTFKNFQWYPFTEFVLDFLVLFCLYFIAWLTNFHFSLRLRDLGFEVKSFDSLKQTEILEIIDEGKHIQDYL